MRSRNAARRQRVGRGRQAVEGGLRRRERDLLLEHDVEQRREPGRPVPQRRWPVAGDDPGEVRVALPRARRRRRASVGPVEPERAQTTDPPGGEPGAPAADRTAGPRRRAATPGRSRRATAGGSRPPGGSRAAGRARRPAGRPRGRRRSSARSRRSGRARTCRSRATRRPPSPGTAAMASTARSVASR